MRVNVQQIRKHRRYSEEFKKHLVSCYEKGEYSVLQLEKLYGVRNPTIYNWIFKYSKFNEKGCRIVEMEESSQKKLAELSAKVQQLEQLVGQKQIAIEYLEKMIDLAKSELDIDIKKNYSSAPFDGSKPTKRK